MSHLFQERSFSHLTYCDACKQLLWGVRKQGFQCKECGYTCHKKCQVNAPKCSSAIKQGFLEDKKVDSRAENYLRELSQKTNVRHRRSSVTSTTSSSSANITAKHIKVGNVSIGESTLDHIKAIATSDKLHNIIAEAATTDQVPVNAYLAGQAPLNPQITARNFTRFVSRCGPVFAFRDELLLLLSWENRVDTLVSLIIYCIVCLYPKMIFFAPQAILVYFILSSYPKRRASFSQTATTTERTEQQQQQHSTAQKNPPVVKKPLEDRANKQAPQDNNNASTLFTFHISSLFQPALDESPEYLRNLQNIQNTMGEFSDAYDWVMAQTDRFNWSSEDKTMRILQLILFSSALLGLVLYVVPIKAIFLSLGVLIYGINTRFAKYIIAEVKPYMIEYGRRNTIALIDWYTELENRLESQDALQEISVFENQRWWSKRGYLHEMINDERSPWSDFTGTVYMPIITEIPAPKGYQWKETSEWTLDTTGPWIDTYLEIEISVKPDSDGWIYSDSNWNISIPQMEPVDFDDGEQHKETLTRRRRWVRECERIDNK